MSEAWIDEAEHLGGSLAWEEYKGDFRQASLIADQRLIDAQRSGQPEQQARALVSQALVEGLRGELSSSAQALDKAEALSEDPSLRLRTANLRLLFYRHKFLRFPDGSGYPTSDLAELWSPTRDSHMLQQTQNLLLEDVTEIAAREAFFIHQVLLDLGARRYLSSRLELLSSEAQQVQRRRWVGEFLAFVETETNCQGARQDRIGYTHRMLADALWRHGKSDQASGHLQLARDAYQAISDPVGEAACLLTLGDRLLSPDTSPLTWCLPIQEPASANTTPWSRRQSSPPSLENLELVRQTYQRAETSFASAHAFRGVAGTLLRLGYLSLLEGSYEEAHRQAQKALELFESTGDRYGFQLSKGHLLMTRLVLETHHTNRPTVEQMGRWGARSGSYSFSLGMGYFLAMVGSERMIPGSDFIRALACHHAAQELFAALGATMAEAQSLADQGTVLRLLRDVPAAAVRYERAIDMYCARLEERLEDPRTVRHHEEEPRQHLRESAVILWQRGVLIADALCGLYPMSEEPEGLEKSLDRLNRLYERNPDPTDPGMFGKSFPDSLDFLVRKRNFVARYWILALQFHDVQHQDQTTRQTLLDKMLDLARGLKSEDRDFFEATTHRLAKRFPKAIAAFERFMTQGGLRADFTGSLSEQMAEAFGPLGQRIVDEGDGENHQIAAMFFARCRDYDRASHQLELLESSKGSAWWRKTERPWESLGLYGEIAEGHGRLEEAIEHFEGAISYLEMRHQRLGRDELKTSLLGSGGTQSIFFGATRAAVKRALSSGDSTQDRLRLADSVIGFAARGKARSLHDLVTEMQTLDSLEDSRQEKILLYRRLSSQLAVWNQQLAKAMLLRDQEHSRLEELMERVESSEQELMSMAQELFSSTDETIGESPLRAQDLIAQLPLRSALVEIYFLEDDFLAWGLTYEGYFQCHHQTLDAQDLSRDIYQLHRLCASGRPLGTLADALGETLLAPLDEIIDSVRHLIIVPFGAAHRLPFQCLTWRGKPLAAQRTISYLPTVGLLRWLPQWQSDKVFSGAQSLVVGDPAMGSLREGDERQRLLARRLPAAEVESRYVSQLVPGATTLIGKAATKDAVLESLSGVQLIHFACHGFLDEKNPLMSSLLLADGDELTVLELAGLRLDARLVVLSACNTAAGKTTRGDDVLGLTRGALASGAEAAVVSLWPVHDLSTSLLMGAFYRRLGQGSTPAEALQAAQKYLRELPPAEIHQERERLTTELAVSSDGLPEVLTREVRSAARGKPNDFSHPFYWASFVVAGVS